MKKRIVFVLLMFVSGIAMVSMKDITTTMMNPLEIESCEALSGCEVKYEDFVLVCEGSDGICEDEYKKGLFRGKISCSGRKVYVSK